MNGSTLSDLLLLAAPLVGAAVNILTQLTLAKAVPSKTLLGVIVAGFAVGGIAALIVAAIALSITLPALRDVLALAATELIVYGAVGLVLFALINLGETSLRIRMLWHLMDAPAGLTEADLLNIYDDTALIAIRLKRIKDNHQTGFTEGVYYPRRSLLFVAASVVRLLKRLIFGSRSSCR
jgi:hypothetical protein